MKTLKKIEQITVTIICAVVIWCTMIVGAFELFYNSFDMSYDPALYTAIAYGIVGAYWLVRKIVFKVIEIVRQ